MFHTFPNKKPPGLIAPLLRFWHLLGNPPKNTCSLFAPFHMESWPKVKLVAPLRVYLLLFCPNIPFWSRFRLVYLYFPIFNFIYQYLPTFSLICPYLVIILCTFNCHNLTIYTIFTLHIYSYSKTAPLCAKF